MSGHPLEPTGAELRAMVEEAVSYLASFLDELPGAPAAGAPDKEALAETLREDHPPAAGAPLADALSVIREAVPRAFDTTG
ncbi:MAG TPA: hypothetical protein VF097_09550, partial [Actinomycetota bacterium]